VPAAAAAVAAVAAAAAAAEAQAAELILRKQRHDWTPCQVHMGKQHFHSVSGGALVETFQQ
jgi:Spy/CpxP family protein refolding chaperone